MLFALCACNLFNDAPEPEPSSTAGQTTPTTTQAPTTTAPPPPAVGERKPLATDAFPFEVPEKLRLLFTKTLLENHGEEIAKEPHKYNVGYGPNYVFLKNNNYDIGYEFIYGIHPKTLPLVIRGSISELFLDKVKLTKEELQSLCGGSLNIGFNDHDNMYYGYISSDDNFYHFRFPLGVNGDEPVTGFELSHYLGQ